ncbi:hypothetical protein CYMTET_29464 [Cymbomonas tetramitiformis]|uniref:Uncharacterized protein n=1 Tax=Cymbomonas tetramitiformis TaxID=36881 RepID=A0AAE0KV49_9CHLO|nr:hypothetical protein CYMTET_29464 [Cymbomonas tetramitiformis]
MSLEKEPNCLTKFMAQFDKKDTPAPAPAPVPTPAPTPAPTTVVAKDAKKTSSASFTSKVTLEGVASGDGFGQFSPTTEGEFKYKMNNGMLLKFAGNDKTFTEPGCPGALVILEERGKFSAKFNVQTKKMSGFVSTKVQVKGKDIETKLAYDQKSAAATVDSTCTINKQNKANIKYNLTNGKTNAKYTFKNQHVEIAPAFSYPGNAWDVTAAKNVKGSAVKLNYNSKKVASMELSKSAFTFSMSSGDMSKGFNLSCTAEKSWDL